MRWKLEADIDGVDRSNSGGFLLLRRIALVGLVGLVGKCGLY